MKHFLLVLSFTLTLTFFSCTPVEKKSFSENQWDLDVESTEQADLYAPHKAEGSFFSPWMKMEDKSLLDVLGWKLFSNTEYTKEEGNFLPRILSDTPDRLKNIQGNFILWIGHNTFLIRIRGEYWLTDPIFSKRALLPARLTPPGLTLDQVNQIAPSPNIIISHNHYDHLDRSSMEKLPKKSIVFVPLGLGDYVKNMDKPQVRQMDWWEEFDLGSGSRLICLPAQHWSMRIDQGRNKSLWASWLLITPEATLYFGGDSGYFKGFREFGKKYPGIDYAFMATTAYHPRWFMRYQHMDVKEAVRGFEELGAKYFIPTQWGTFRLGSEPAGFPGLDLARHIQAHNLDAARFKILDIGGILPF